LSCPVLFELSYLPAKGTTGDILGGVREEKFSVSGVSILKYSVSCILQDKKTGFNWRLVIIYGSPYEEGKVEFIDELHLVLSNWQGPTLVGGDFNLSRFSSHKSNGRIILKWVDCFNDWVNRWG
jgi:hypothetical protein